MRLEELEENEELGRMIFESVPGKARPGWGTTLLQTFEPFIKSIPTSILNLYPITEDETLWGKAHDQFTEIRKFGLANKNFEPESYVTLAERVAKITYNESGLSAPFDHNSGWFIPILSKRTAEFFKDETLKDEILRIFSVNLK